MESGEENLIESQETWIPILFYLVSGIIILPLSFILSVLGLSGLNQVMGYLCGAK